MYKLGNLLLLTAVIIIILVGGGVLLNIVPASSRLVAPSTVISLMLIGIGVSLKNKHKNT